MPKGISRSYQLDQSISILRGVGWYFYFLFKGALTRYGKNIGVCPRLEFDNIMLSNYLGYDFYIHGAFEFLCNSIIDL